MMYQRKNRNLQSLAELLKAIMEALSQVKMILEAQIVLEKRQRNLLKRKNTLDFLAMVCFVALHDTNVLEYFGITPEKSKQTDNSGSDDMMKMLESGWNRFSLAAQKAAQAASETAKVIYYCVLVNKQDCC